VVADYDGVLGLVFGMNNFYFYRFQGTKRSAWIAWDKDSSFDAANKPIMENIFENVLARRIMDRPEWRGQYLNALLRAAAIAGGAGGWLSQELERLSGVIRESASTDPHKQCMGSDGAMGPCSAADFEAGVNHLREFLALRAGFVFAEAQRAALPVVRPSPSK
jgi:hypothetical protein